MYLLKNNLESLKIDLVFIISNEDDAIDMDKELQVQLGKMIPYIITCKFSNIPTIIACNILIAIISTDYDLALELLTQLISELDYSNVLV